LDQVFSALDRQTHARAVLVDRLRLGRQANELDLVAGEQELDGEQRTVGRAHDQDIVSAHVRYSVGLWRDGERTAIGMIEPVAQCYLGWGLDASIPALSMPNCSGLIRSPRCASVSCRFRPDCRSFGSRAVRAMRTNPAFAGTYPFTDDADFATVCFWHCQAERSTVQIELRSACKSNGFST